MISVNGWPDMVKAFDIAIFSETIMINIKIFNVKFCMMELCFDHIPRS